MNQPSDVSRIKLALIDDHGLFREGLSRLLGSEPDMEVIGQHAGFAEALQFLSGSPVDIILLELKIRAERSDTFISAAQQAGYRGKFFLVTRAIDAAQSAAALKLGASGIFLKSDSSLRLLCAIRLVASGEIWVDQRVIQLIADRYPQHEDQGLDGLTQREQAVLKGLLDGLTNRNIGNKIGVSESSIKATLQQLFEKAGVRTRSQLVRAALEGVLGGASSHGQSTG
ncbi:MAG: response regulator transcription factor [Candidatus Sulfopaludibacter sp.]|nr:response regulator transcription factor [Candidatus Sulfopaludibacter sp.]